jgi:hypothetical protein
MAEAPPTHAEAEERMRELLRDNDLPEPDSVLYDDGEVVFLWHEPKRAVIVELDGGRSGLDPG